MSSGWMSECLLISYFETSLGLPVPDPVIFYLSQVMKTTLKLAPSSPNFMQRNVRALSHDRLTVHQTLYKSGKSSPRTRTDILKSLAGVDDHRSSSSPVWIGMTYNDRF
ncbi:hypothetical protein TNCV_84431 [Trichonephila clavipes]|nr:hypothetical protein TNCV_84431 [Trichonephila clavipes]